MTLTLDRADIQGFRSVVAARLGLHFDDSKQDFLADVLRDRMESAGCDCFSLYERRMATSVREMQAVAEQLTVCETYFFRYAEHFLAFTEVVVPALIRARGRGRKLRILSAGCASGEEAYSLAILIRDRLQDLLTWDLAIHGVDVNQAMVKRALKARYHAWSLRSTPEDLRSRYFRGEGRDFVLDSDVKGMVTFEERNLIEEDPAFWHRARFDVIFCRNVTMYFTVEAARTVVNRMGESLCPGGFLFLGHAETLRGISQDFHLRHTHQTFYYQRKEGHETNFEGAVPESSAALRSSWPGVSVPEPPSNSWFDIIRRASERIVTLTDTSSLAGVAPAKPPSPPSQPMAQPEAPVETGAAAVSRRGKALDRTAAIALMQEERFGEAIAILRGLPAASNADADVQLLLAALLTNSGDLAEAEKICTCLLDLDELNAGAHYLTALCREHAGDPDSAAEHDRAAIYLDSSFAMPHLHLGLIAKRSRDGLTAGRELGEALALLLREDAARILLFGGGFTRDALAEFCRAELRASGGVL